jgi:uncharacterized protein YbjQ (UPF0145 family)
MSTTDTLPEGLPQGCVINRTAIMTSRNHNTPGDARDGLAEWAQKCNYNAVVGVRLLATAELINPGDDTTDTKWAAYGTAIGW